MTIPYLLKMIFDAEALRLTIATAANAINAVFSMIFGDGIFKCSFVY